MESAAVIRRRRAIALVVAVVLHAGLAGVVTLQRRPCTPLQGAGRPVSRALDSRTAPVAAPAAVTPEAHARAREEPGAAGREVEILGGPLATQAARPTGGLAPADPRPGGGSEREPGDGRVAAGGGVSLAVAPQARTPEPRLYRSPPILVQADRIPAPCVVQPGRYAFTPETLGQQIASFEDVTRSVQALPGVGSASDLHGEFFVRGTGSHANSVYLDGIEVFFPYHILGFNSIFNPGLIESAEFFSGGAPAQYGDATGGVLVVRSRGRTPTRSGTALGLSYLSGQASAEGGDARLGWVASLRRSYHDKLLQLVGAAAGREVPTFHDVLLRGRWQPSPEHLLVAGVVEAGDGMSLPQPEVRASDLDFVNLDPNADPTAVANARRSLALNDRLRLGNRLTLASLLWRALLGRRAYLETTFGYAPQSFEFSLRGDNHESVSIRSRVTTLRQDLAWRPPGHSLRAGWLAYRDDSRRQVSAWVGILELRESNSAINLADLKERYEIDAGRRRDYGAAYAEDEYTPWPDWLTLGAGLRWEHDGLSRQRLVSPRLSAELRPGSRCSLRATWGLYHGLRDKPMEILPSADGRPLGAEQSVETTLGVRADLRADCQAGLTAYAKRLSLLVYEPSPARFANGGEGRARGLEAWLRLRPLRLPLSAQLSYVWSVSEERDPVAWRRLPNYYAQSRQQFWGPVYETPYWYNPIQDERHRLGLEVELVRRRWELGLRYQLGSGRPYTPVEFVATDPLGSKYGVVGRTGSARYPLYQRLDVRVLRQLRTRGVRWSVYADILNATSADNVFQYRYNPAYTARYTVHMLPTLPTLGVEAHF